MGGDKFFMYIMDKAEVMFVFTEAVDFFVILCMIWWKNWMVLHVMPQEVVDDACEVGKSIGLKVNGVIANMFSVMSREKVMEIRRVEYMTPT